jgi:hypothetical protein
LHYISSKTPLQVLIIPAALKLSSSLLILSRFTCASARVGGLLTAPARFTIAAPGLQAKVSMVPYELLSPKAEKISIIGPASDGRSYGRAELSGTTSGFSKRRFRWEWAVTQFHRYFPSRFCLINSSNRSSFASSLPTSSTKVDSTALPGPRVARPAPPAPALSQTLRECSAAHRRTPCDFFPRVR